MRKTRDILYTIFMGLILFLSGAIILGGIEYFINEYIGFDIVSVILFFIAARYLTILVLKGLSTTSKFYSIYIQIMVILMYIFKDYVFFLVYYIVSGANIFAILKSIPYLMYERLLSYFIYSSEIGLGYYVLNLFSGILDVVILFVGVYTSYKITKIYNNKA